jgi:hypothetical protein
MAAALVRVCIFSVRDIWSPQSEASLSPYENEETVALNGAIIRSFVREATAAGTIPIVAFLPSFMEFRDAGTRLSGTPLLGILVLEQSDVEFVDLTGCVERVDERERFTTGWHYTSRAGSTVAGCLKNIVEERVAGGRYLQRCNNCVNESEIKGGTRPSFVNRNLHEDIWTCCAGFDRRLSHWD